MINVGTTFKFDNFKNNRKFKLPLGEERYNIVGKYTDEGYPANPNGSHYDVAMLCDVTRRRSMTMSHVRRSTYKCNWTHYPKDRNDQISPWHRTACQC